MVHTATHGTLPMAALEDAVFRLLTPATGAPVPQGAPIYDPLAPNPVKIPIAHTQYLPNSSPTCVTDVSHFPAWVDAKNPPNWYNDGADIEKLLEDADCLNWLSDTGDLDETYVPPGGEMDFSCEPTPVASAASSSYNHSTTSCTNSSSILSVAGEVEPTSINIKMEDQEHGTFDGELSFLMDAAEEEVEESADHNANHIPLPSFLEGSDCHDANDHIQHPSVTYASATEAIDAVPDSDKLHHDNDHSGLMGFPDLDMGDEQAFVSALLENSGQSSISFPKLHSDLGVHVSTNGESSSEMELNALAVGESSEYISS